MISDQVNEASVKMKSEMILSTQPCIDKKALYGILEEFVQIAANNSEASSVAVSANVIAFFCATLGRVVYQWIGDNKIHCRPFFILAGKSGKARKGTSETLVRRVFHRVDELLQGKNSEHNRLNIHGGGLSSGEGICYAIRDPYNNDLGIPDKRLLVIEPEFANVLANCKRETSTLSPVIRNVFDGHDMAPLTKANQTCSTNPHVVIVGHITSQELKNKVLKGVETTNGFLNRFLILYVVREKLVPLPDPTSSDEIDQLAKNVIDILEFINQESGRHSGELEIYMNEEAKQYWKMIYSKISQDNPGIIGSLLARSELYCRMFAMIFAVFDKKLVIEVAHIKAAECWAAYVQQSVWHIFSNIKEQNEETDINNFAGRILELLKKKAMTLTEISKAFNGHKTSEETRDALSRLLSQSPVAISESFEKTKGRPRVIYSAK